MAVSGKEKVIGEWDKKKGNWADLDLEGVGGGRPARAGTVDGG